MPSLTVPSPVLPSITTPVVGAGFDPKRKVQLAVDTVGYTTNYFRARHDGTFQVGINCGSTLGTHTVTARYAGNATVIASAIVVVQKAAPPPPPPVDPPPPSGTTREAKSISDLTAMLGDEAIDIITMAPKVWPQPNVIMLSAIRRTKPVVVRSTAWTGAALPDAGKVLFDGGGAPNIGVRFHDGTSQITFEDCIWQNRRLSMTGVVFFDGDALPAAHHITLRRCGVRSCTGVNERNEHGIYISHSTDGSHDVLLEDFLVDGGAGLVSPPNLSTGIHFYHSGGGLVNAHDWIIRRMTIKNTFSQFLIWDPTVRNVLVEDLRCIGIVKAANGVPGTSIRLEAIPAGSGIVFKHAVVDGEIYSSDGSDKRVTFLP